MKKTEKLYICRADFDGLRSTRSNCEYRAIKTSKNDTQALRIVSRTTKQTNHNDILFLGDRKLTLCGTTSGSDHRRCVPRDYKLRLSCRTTQKSSHKLGVRARSAYTQLGIACYCAGMDRADRLPYPCRHLLFFDCHLRHNHGANSTSNGQTTTRAYGARVRRFVRGAYAGYMDAYLRPLGQSESNSPSGTSQRRDGSSSPADTPTDTRLPYTPPYPRPVCPYRLCVLRLGTADPTPPCLRCVYRLRTLRQTMPRASHRDDRQTPAMDTATMHNVPALSAPLPEIRHSVQPPHRKTRTIYIQTIR